MFVQTALKKVLKPTSVVRLMRFRQTNVRCIGDGKESTTEARDYANYAHKGHFENVDHVDVESNPVTANLLRELRGENHQPISKMHTNIAEDGEESLDLVHASVAKAWANQIDSINPPQNLNGKNGKNGTHHKGIPDEDHTHCNECEHVHHARDHHHERW